jgi:hypothetical protein
MTYAQNHKFPANSLIIPCAEAKFAEFWAEFEALNPFAKYFPAFFPAPWEFGRSKSAKPCAGRDTAL